MSKSTKMMIVLGLAVLLAPTTTSSQTINDGYMEEQIVTTRTKEIIKESVEFTSTISEMMTGKEDIIEVEKEYIEISCELTFYTSLASCNGDSLGLTASGKKLNPSTLAVPRKVGSTRPVFPFGTIIEIERYGEKLVQDTGNPKYLKVKNDGTYIFDVYIPRNKGESDSQYRKRVLSYGRVQTSAKVYLKDGE